MSDKTLFYNELFKGLRALAESSFPKKCSNCGRIFKDSDQFLAETQDVSTVRSGLKQSRDDDGSTIVEVFRNCVCGSTLLEIFGDRRDLSKAGMQRRKKFDELLQFLEKHGIERQIARTELLKVLHGEKSEILANFRVPGSKTR